MCEVRGEAIASAPFLAIDGAEGPWLLRGAGSSLRYTTAMERGQLQAKQQGLGRPASTRAALIPIRKSAEWWAMAQDERRAVYERGAHLPIGLDFLTWFEFAPDQEAAFDHMLERLRECAEWDYVDREVDIRLTRV